jgi:hypothetical protein
MEKHTVDGGFQCDPDLDESVVAPFAAMEEALRSTARSFIGKNTIKGRASKCYELAQADAFLGKVCLDDELGLPLYMDILHPSTGYRYEINNRQVIVTPGEPELGLPAERERGPVDLTTLGIPSVLLFE